MADAYGITHTSRNLTSIRVRALRADAARNDDYVLVVACDVWLAGEPVELDDYAALDADEIRSARRLNDVDVAEAAIIEMLNELEARQRRWSEAEARYLADNS